MANAHGLNPRQEMFCREYIIDWNITRAARAAGYARESACHSGQNVLDSGKGVAFIGELLQDAMKMHDMQPSEVVHRYVNMVRADRRGLVDENGQLKGLHELPEDLASCIDGYEIKPDGTVKFKLVSQRAALRDVAEMLALFKVVTDNTHHVQLTAIERTIVDPSDTDSP